ncbi:MAG: hypothetical protein U0Q11_02870 [Vicinamibacterales bacterium]
MFLFRIQRFLTDVVGQRKTIAERPIPGLAHAFVFWGFVAFGGYTLCEFLAGLGLLDITHTEPSRPTGCCSRRSRSRCCAASCC